MNKYGVGNFIVEQLFECDELKLDSYEILFIEKLDTYHNGYNATKGGDGSILFDYKQIIELYQSGLTIKQVSTQVQCCIDTVRKVLNLYNIDRHAYLTGSCQQRKKVIQIDIDTKKEIQTFHSIADAAHWLVDNGYAKTYNGGVRQKISLCVQGKLKTAYKFIWR